MGSKLAFGAGVVTAGVMSLPFIFGQAKKAAKKALKLYIRSKLM